MAGLALAFDSHGGLVTHFGFGLLAVCWIYTTLQAYRFVRAGNIRQHQEWMVRSYALTLAAVTLRVYLGLFVVAGMEFDEAYRAIAWLCWVPNILIAEWVILFRGEASKQAGI